MHLQKIQDYDLIRKTALYGQTEKQRRSNRMEIVIIDGQGGRIGRELAAIARARCPGAHITAAGTNSTAAAVMLKAAPDACTAGEAAVIDACRKADVILGPLGIVIAGAMLGEISPAMATAVGSAKAVRLLVPMNRCANLVAGVPDVPLSRLLADAGDKLAALAEGEKK